METEDLTTNSEGATTSSCLSLFVYKQRALGLTTTSRAMLTVYQ